MTMFPSLGTLIEFAQKLFLKITPSLEIRSMFGVSLRLLPYALVAFIAWSSENINNIFGLLVTVLTLSTANAVELATTAPTVDNDNN